MSVQLTTATKNVVIDAILGLLNVGSLFSNARVMWLSEDTFLLGMMPLSNPAFAPASAGVANMNAATDTLTTVDVPKVVGRTVWLDRNNLGIFQVYCAVSGGDLNSPSLAISPGDTLRISAFSLGYP